jgi:hypothetical protein
MAVDGEVEACKGGKVKKRKGKTLNTTTPQSLSRKLSDGSSAVACDKQGNFNLIGLPKGRRTLTRCPKKQDGASTVQPISPYLSTTHYLGDTGLMSSESPFLPALLCKNVSAVRILGSGNHRIVESFQAAGSSSGKCPKLNPTKTLAAWNLHTLAAGSGQLPGHAPKPTAWQLNNQEPQPSLVDAPAKARLISNGTTTTRPPVC